MGTELRQTDIIGQLSTLIEKPSPAFSSLLAIEVPLTRPVVVRGSMVKTEAVATA